MLSFAGHDNNGKVEKDEGEGLRSLLSKREGRHCVLYSQALLIIVNKRTPPLRSRFVSPEIFVTEHRARPVPCGKRSDDPQARPGQACWSRAGLRPHDVGAACRALPAPRAARDPGTEQGLWFIRD